MPGWEKIEFKNKPLKRKETYNDFGRKIRFEPLQSIPRLRKCNSYTETYDDYRETLVWSENEELVNKTTEFVKLAKSKGFTEEQALHILTYHDFDEGQSRCDLEIYRPIWGLRSSRDRESIRMIVDNVRERISSGKNRDLNLVLLHFPAHTIGELLDFYGNNRLYIKMKTSKEKLKNRKVAKSKVTEFCENADFRKCGSILRENGAKKMGLPELLTMGSGGVRRGLSSDGALRLEAVTPDEILCRVSGDSGMIEEEEEEDVSERLRSVLASLEAVERWMNPLMAEEVIRHKWDNMDLALLLLGLQRYGPDFERLSEVVASKTAPMVESFYVTFKDRYGLDRIVRDGTEHGSPRL